MNEPVITPADDEQAALAALYRQCQDLHPSGFSADGEPYWTLDDILRQLEPLTYLAAQLEQWRAERDPD